MRPKSKRGCLSSLFFFAAIAFAFYTVYSHFSKDATPVDLGDAATSLAWLLGLAIFFRIISPRKRHDESPDRSFTVTVESVDRGSSDISASARQLEYIKSLGGTPKQNMTMSEASAMIDELKIEREIQHRKEVKRRLAESQ